MTWNYSKTAVIDEIALLMVPLESSIPCVDLQYFTSLLSYLFSSFICFSFF